MRGFHAAIYAGHKVAAGIMALLVLFDAVFRASEYPAIARNPVFCMCAGYKADL